MSDPWDEIPEVGTAPVEGGPADAWGEIPEVGGEINAPAEPLEVGVTLEGLDAEAEADRKRAEEERNAQFRPVSELGPEHFTSDPSAGRPNWDQNASAARRFLNAVSDTAQKAAMAATMGYGDEILGAVAGPEVRDRIRDRQALAEERSPVASVVGDIGGSLALAPVTGGGNLAARLASGAAQSAVAGSGYADGDARARAEGAALGGALGLGGGAVGEGMSAGGSKAARYLLDKAKDLKSAALRKRVASTGHYSGSFNRLADNRGDDGIEELGQWIEDRGIHKGEGLLGWLPQTPEVMKENAEAVNKAAMGARSEITDKIAARQAAADALEDVVPEDVVPEDVVPEDVVPEDVVADLVDSGELAEEALGPAIRVNSGAVAQRLDDFANEASTSADSAYKNQAAFARNKANLIRESSDAKLVDKTNVRYDELGFPHAETTKVRVPGTEYQPFLTALKQREADDALLNHNQIGGPLSDSLDSEARRISADTYRGELQKALDTQAPELAGPWRKNQHEIHNALSVIKAARERMNREEGNQAVSLPTWMATAGGLGIGGAGSAGAAYAADKNPYLSGIGGALAGGLIASQAKSRGRSAQAGLLKALAGAARGTGQAARATAPAAAPSARAGAQALTADQVRAKETPFVPPDSAPSTIPGDEYGDIDPNDRDAMLRRWLDAQRANGGR